MYVYGHYDKKLIKKKPNKEDLMKNYEKYYE